MSAPACNVLFLCTGNSARSVMAEAMLNVLGHGRFRAYSAGSFPNGSVQPIAAKLADTFGYHEPLRSKSWNEFAQPGAPELDIVITVCDNAAAELCPIWPRQPITAHWGVPDPAAVRGSEETRLQAFQSVWLMLRERIDRLLALPMSCEQMDTTARLALQQELRSIGTVHAAGVR